MQWSFKGRETLHKEPEQLEQMKSVTAWEKETTAFPTVPELKMLSK